MKSYLLIGSAFLAASAAFCIDGMPTAVAAECTGPFRQCAIDVNAVCSRDANGQQRITYWDASGNTIYFEQCVGRVFEANGQASPYRTPSALSASARRGMGLQAPYTEVLFPKMGTP